MTWNDISVKYYQELFELFENHSYTKEEYEIKLISFIKDIPEEELENYSVEEYNSLVKDITFFYGLPNKKPRNSVKTSAGELYLIDDLFAITIGEYIDLESFFSQGYVKNLPIICSILYRQKNNINPLLYKDKYEDYGDWIYLRASLFEELPIDSVYGLIPKYISFKQEFEKLFESLISSQEEDEIKEEIPKDESYADKHQRLKDEEQKSSRDKYGWDLFLFELSRLNNCTFEEATKIPLLQAFGLHALKQAFKGYI